MKYGLYILAFLFFHSHEAFSFEEKHILKGTTLDYPPYQYEKGGLASGLAIEILNETVRRTNIQGVSVEFFPWKRAVNSIENGPKEVLFNAGKNDARQLWGTYSKHVLILQQYFLFTKKGSNIQTSLDFENMSQRNIAVRDGYLYGTGPFKKAITSDKKFFQITKTNSTEQSIRLLMNGRVDMFVGDFLPVMHYIKNNALENQIELVKEIGTGKELVVLDWPTYFLFSKKNVPQIYIDNFDAALTAMKNDGTYQKIYQKYNFEYQLPSN